MSREWNDDGDEGDLPLHLWEAALEKSINGKRGQKFLRELEAELLAMKERGEGRLLAGYFIADGSLVKNSWNGKEEPLPVGCCTIGVMCKLKNVPADISKLNQEIEDPYDFSSRLPKALNIASSLIAEIGTNNDCPVRYSDRNETDEQRFERMLKWVQCHISRNGEWITRDGRSIPLVNPSAPAPSAVRLVPSTLLSSE